MDEIKIFWTATAVKQRDSTFQYWNNRNQSTNYSKKMNLIIKERLELLKSFPEMGKLTDFKDTKVIFIAYYSILYKIDKLKIIITGFWDNRQDPKKLYKLLKENP